MLLYHLFCALCALFKKSHDLCIYLRSHFIRVGPQIFPIFEPNISNPIIHSQFCYNIEGNSIGLIQIVRSSICASSIEVLLRASSSEYKAYLIDQLVLGAQLILVAEVLSESK